MRYALVFLNGIVGNNTNRALDPDEFQGFVLVDEIAPLIFINSADYKGPKMFTLIHELAHLWIGKSALFDFQTTSSSSNNEVEIFCNKVAAEFLVPSDSLYNAWEIGREMDELLATLSQRFKVSVVVVARRAVDLELITPERFFAFYHDYMEKVSSLKASRKSGGNFWNNQNVRVGKKFGTAVVSAAKEGRITYSDAYDLTQLYGKTFDKFTRSISGSSN